MEAGAGGRRAGRGTLTASRQGSSAPRAGSAPQGYRNSRVRASQQTKAAGGAVPPLRVASQGLAGRAPVAAGSGVPLLLVHPVPSRHPPRLRLVPGNVDRRWTAGARMPLQATLAMKRCETSLGLGYNGAGVVQICGGTGGVETLPGVEGGRRREEGGGRGAGGEVARGAWRRAAGTLRGRRPMAASFPTPMRRRCWILRGRHGAGSPASVGQLAPCLPFLSAYAGLRCL